MTEFEYKNAHRGISDSLRAYGLTELQITELTEACFKLSTTTVYQNSDLTIHLLHQCVDLIRGKKETPNEILERLTKEYSGDLRNSLENYEAKTNTETTETKENSGVIASNGLQSPEFEVKI